VAGEPGLIPRLEDRGAFPGARFGEDVVGTNGLGTAIEERQPFIVAGSEHFRAHESEATTAGAPVRDPVTGRLAGLLNVNCPYRLTNGLLLPFVTELARSIEARLLACRPAADRALLDEFLRASRRSPQPVVAVSERVFIANAAALALLEGTDHALLRQWACDAARSGREYAARLQLTPDRAVTARCRPVPGLPGHAAAVLILTPCPGPVAAARAPMRSSSWERLISQLDQPREGRLPLLLWGERGTGKTVLARRLHDAGAAGDLTVLDAADGACPGDDWTRRLRAALADPARTVVLRHLDALDPALVRPTAGLIEFPRARLAATSTERPGSGAERAGLAERFPVVLHVPPLRDRAADIPALVSEIIAELRPGSPRPRCTPAALTALARGDWPGNVRQLRQVVATALVSAMSCDITVNDLPEPHAWAGPGRRPSGLERAERQALVTALRDAAGDREAAARELGISRATIYRKLKRHGIGPPPAPGPREARAR
jgi:sigma-54 dependent transcriptional regulator, acetoin dehydrogenase operon transcriptional activator AcoR